MKTLAVAAALCLIAPSAGADSIVFSSGPDPSGSISSAGFGQPVIGAGLSVEKAEYQDSSGGVIWSRILSGGSIDFDSGAGTFAVVGSFDASPAVLLFAGTIDYASDPSESAPGSWIAAVSGTGHYTQAMLDAYESITGHALHDLTYDFAAGVAFEAPSVLDGFNSSAISTIAPIGAQHAAPEPASIIMLGIGAMVIGWRRRSA
jgi:hypothetical protein